MPAASGTRMGALHGAAHPRGTDTTMVARGVLAAAGPAQRAFSWSVMARAVVRRSASISSHSSAAGTPAVSESPIALRSEPAGNDMTRAAVPAQARSISRSIWGEPYQQAEVRRVADSDGHTTRTSWGSAPLGLPPTWREMMRKLEGP